MHEFDSVTSPSKSESLSSINNITFKIPNSPSQRFFVEGISDYISEYLLKFRKEKGGIIKMSSSLTQKKQWIIFISAFKNQTD